MDKPNENDQALEDGQKDLEDEEEETEEEKKILAEAQEKKEQVKQMFIDNYDFEEDDPKLEVMVERELQERKTFSTLVGKNVALRKKMKKGEKIPANPQPPKEAGALEKIKTPKRTKAAQVFIGQLQKKYPDRDVKEMYSKVQEHYKEDGSELTEEDFSSAIREAFSKAFPDLVEEEIRQDERIKISEQLPELDFSGLSSKDKLENKPKKSFRLKSVPIQDWYKPKK